MPMRKKRYHYRLNWHFTASVFAAIFIMATVGACSPRLSVHGSVIDKQKLAEVKPGQMTRREVQEILGSPSSKAVFDKESWYYISSRTESFAFFEPKITQRKIVIIRFDKKGLVSNVDSLNLKDGQKIQMVDRVTPTKGKEYSLIEQLVGNIGTYHKRTSAGAGPE
jgi:outer membrane protein assembly factor BamE (lipoprotein component of BamABCDE complex)